MLNYQQNFPLSQLTTFRIGGEALYYVKIANIDELKEALDFANPPAGGKSLPVLIMGGGSNLLVSDEGFPGLVIEIDLKGIEIVSETDLDTEIKVSAGEIWDDVVMWAIRKNLWGIENMSGIPGKTGAVPVQNVGAYGQEANKVITRLEVLDLKTQEIKILTNEDSMFGYRSSHFNTDWKNKFAILSVSFRLSKLPKPNLTYVDLKKKFEDNPNPNLRQIRDIVIEIRKNKFPDLSEMGTAGSFFKNLILTKEQFESLKPEVQQMLAEIKDKFPTPDGFKIPAAFLLDKLGLKGKNVGNAKLWEKQPLVIVNTSNATAKDVVELYDLVRKEVFAKTGLELTHEPEFVGFTEY